MNIALPRHRVALCILLFALFCFGVFVSLHPQRMEPQMQWTQDRLHSTIEALGAGAAIGMAIVLLVPSRNRRARFSLATGFLCMGILDAFHAACVGLHGLVLLHVSSCLVGGAGYALGWAPPCPRQRRTWLLSLCAVSCLIFGSWVLFAGERAIVMLASDGDFAFAAKFASLMAAALFLLGSVRFVREFIGRGDTQCLLFLSLALLFAFSDITFATSRLWDEEWWSWHVTRFFAFVLAFGFVVRGYLDNAAKIRIALVEQRRIERKLRRRTRDLNERVVELNCLYRTHKLMEQANTDVEEICRGVTRVLCSSFRFPDLVRGRIVYEGVVFESPDYRDTPWKLTCPITCCQAPIGSVEICYLKEQPAINGSPFTDEEQRLLIMVSEQLSETIKRKRLESEVAQISTWERQRFGQELHDELGQELTGLGYLAQCLRHDLGGDGSASEATAAKLANGLQASIGRTRLIAKGQALADVDATDFIPSLQAVTALAEERWGIPCRVYSGRELYIDDEDTANQLLRIAQEAIFNAAKHAKARRICVHVRRRGDHLMLRIRDDGIGMPEHARKGQGMGIHIMHHRANAACATLEIGTAKTGGTVVTVCCLMKACSGLPEVIPSAHFQRGRRIPAGTGVVNS